MRNELIILAAFALLVSGCSSAPPAPLNVTLDMEALCAEFAGIYKCSDGSQKLVGKIGYNFMVLSPNGTAKECPPLAPARLDPECRAALDPAFCGGPNLCESFTEDCILNRCDCRCYKNGTVDAAGGIHCTADCMAMYNVSGCEFVRNKGCSEKRVVQKPKIDLISCSEYSDAMMCTMDYDPVCALVMEEGRLVWREFGNACSACANQRETSGYLQGKCGPGCVSDASCGEINCTGYDVTCLTGMCATIKKLGADELCYARVQNNETGAVNF